MRPCVIGTGVMGAPIARNLAAAGFPVTVWSRSARSRDAVADIATVASGARAALEASDVVLLLVPGEAEIDEVLERGPDGVAAPVRDRVVVTMATVAPAYSERLAADVAAAGGRYAEAPLSGSRKPAEAGTLLVLAAGDDEVLDALGPLFAPISRGVVRCGLPPAAMRTKLANNVLLIGLLASLTEAAHFAERMGLDLAPFLDMVLAGPIANDVVRAKAPKLVSRDFAPEAPLKHVAKDLRLVADEALRVGARVPVASVLREVFAEAAADGLGESDVTALLRLLDSS